MSIEPIMNDADAISVLQDILNNVIEIKDRMPNTAGNPENTPVDTAKRDEG
jgi:hypothetical protein